MASNLIVIPGSKRVNFPILQGVARDFGWVVSSISDVNEIAAFMQGRRIVALLVSKDALGPGNTWTEIIQRLKGSLPDVNLVTCHGFSDPINWEELSAAGVFHAIHLPLKENELRQALGFVWEAERRRAESSQPVSVGIPVIQRSVKTEIAS